MNAKVTEEEVYAAIEGALSELYLESNEGVTIQKLLEWCEALKASIYAHATAEKIARLINDADEIRPRIYEVKTDTEK